jgi:hypothetical protein
MMEIQSLQYEQKEVGISLSGSARRPAERGTREREREGRRAGGAHSPAVGSVAPAGEGEGKTAAGAASSGTTAIAPAGRVCRGWLRGGGGVEESSRQQQIAASWTCSLTRFQRLILKCCQRAEFERARVEPS